MEFFDVIYSRRSSRQYTDFVPPQEDIKKIIDAARVAPSAINAQMWHFVAIYNQELKQKLTDAISEKFDEMLTWPESQDKKAGLENIRKNSVFIINAPVVIACYMKPIVSVREKALYERGFTEAEVRRMVPKRDIMSMGAAIENAFLAGTALGYGVAWLGAPVLAYEKIEKLINFDPEYYFVSFLAIGKGNDPKPQPQKKMLDEVLTIIE